jgi:hypothetical protein
MSVGLIAERRVPNWMLRDLHLPCLLEDRRQAIT